jgi:hypothetical protein
MPARNGKDVERGDARRLPRGLRIDLSADASDEFRRAAFSGQHSAKKKQIARLNGFRIGAEGLGWGGELNAEFLNPLLRACLGTDNLVRTVCAVHVGGLPKSLASDADRPLDEGGMVNVADE